jgi:CRP/FNR family transcriptional regulator
MLSTQELDELTAAFPALLDDPDLARTVAEHGTYVRLDGGAEVFAYGHRPDMLALVISGSVRVYKESPAAREITLYRVHPGEFCVLTARSILQRSALPASATTQESLRGVAIPASVFRRLLDERGSWRDFLFGLLSQRLADVMDLIDDVVFARLDERLASHLVTQANADGAVVTTHQRLAGDLGSTREVISRVLEDFAARGFIRQARGRIELLDRAGLTRHAAR